MAAEIVLFRMFYAVILLHSKKRIVLPERWINFGVDRNFGIVKGPKKYLVFYSPDQTERPNFEYGLVQNDFDATAGYYWANILYVFGMFDILNYFFIIL